MNPSARAALFLSFTFTVAACATSGLHEEGLQAMQEGRYEEAIAKLEAAVDERPRKTEYRAAYQRERERAVQALLREAGDAFAAGQLDAAEQAYQRAATIEGRGGRASHGLEMVARERRERAELALAAQEIQKGKYEEADGRVRTVLEKNPRSAEALRLSEQLGQLRGPVDKMPRVQAAGNRPVTLQFRDASTKMVFEVLSRQTGINFVFDKDVKTDGKTTIFVQQVPIEQAIDLILGQNQLGRQVLGENLVMIYPNTPAKQKEYQDQVVRTFYVVNTEPQRAMEMLKTVIGAGTLFVDERAGALVMRDTPEAVRMAERLLAAVDVPAAEVMMEVEVLEVTRSQLEELGIRYPQNITVTPTPLSGDFLSLDDLRNQTSETLQATGALSAGVDLSEIVGRSSLLASPRIRARNREKARVHIGQRVPVITNSVTPTTTAPVVTGNVQYVDVGLALEVEPTIYLDNDVAIKVNLEVSSIIKEVISENSGTLAYQIGTRSASTLLQLRDGETQLLAGLINDVERRTMQRIPGLGELPVLGRLFGSQKDDVEKSEIILSITPRIIRSQRRPQDSDMEFWFGTEGSRRNAPLVASLSPVATGAAAPAAQAGGRAPIVPAAALPGVAAEAVTGGFAALLSGPEQVKAGQDFEVALRVEGAEDLAGLRAVLRYEAAALELTSVDPGSLLGDAASQGAEAKIDQRTGTVTMTLPEGSFSGDGDVFVMRFKATAPRPATVMSVQQVSASRLGGGPVAVDLRRSLTVNVEP